jgi:hypothetical protein
LTTMIQPSPLVQRTRFECSISNFQASDCDNDRTQSQ